MSEIEKMYENAELRYYYCGDDYIAEYMLEKECTKGDREKCKKCMFVKRGHSPFTAEKQLELINWLGELQIDTRKGYWHLAKFGRTTKTIYADNGNSGEALSEIVNQLWQSLTEEERKQIKEILE